MNYTTDQIRNLAIAGHGATGKTTLVEQLLFVGGQIARPETVESGKTVSDFTEEEIEHRSSIHTSLSHVYWKDHKINLLDTPGASDFAGEVHAAFRSAESALLVVDAEAGVQIETIKLWRTLDQRDKPRVIFINKSDKDRANVEKVISDLNERFKMRFVALTLPMRGRNGYEGVIDLVHMKAYKPSGQGKQESETEIPAEYLEAARNAHETMIDAAAEGDDDLSEKYLEGQELTVAEAVEGLREDLRDHKVVPVFCGSALQCSGIFALLDIVNLIAPSPAGLHDWTYDKNHNEIEQPISVTTPPSFFCFKTSLDQFAGKLSFVKVMTGLIKPEAELLNVREQKREKIGKIYAVQGKKLEECDTLVAGDIGILAKLASAHTNDSFADPAKPFEYHPLKLPQAIHHLAIFASSKKDEDKASEFLAKALEEDKTLSLRYDPETKETVLSGLGEMHLNLLFEKLKKTYKIEVRTQVPKIAYRETITGPAEAEYTHKKQSGGHGQYARVNIRVKPMPRGETFRFVNDIHGGAVSRNYLTGVEKGVVDAMLEGSLAGFPVVDMEVTIFDGKEHPVDSSDMAFQLAARGAVKEALSHARAILLEPVMELRVYVEDRFLGDVLSDISGKRGRVLSQNSAAGGITEVIAEVPQAELMRYGVDLRSMTSGTGSFEMHFVRYAELSGRQADEILRNARQNHVAAAV